MIEGINELWMVIASMKRDDAKTTLEVQEGAMQRFVIEACKQTEGAPGERRYRLRRLFRLSGLTEDEWSELMPMEAQFA